MLLVSAQYSDYAYYRVKVANPYTATTTASLYYYFGWLGVIPFYIIAGLFYGKLIKQARISLGSNRLFESMIIVKLISCFHALLCASDLYLISYKGVVYIVLYFILVELRKKKIRIIIGNLELT